MRFAPIAVLVLAMLRPEAIVARSDALRGGLIPSYPSAETLEDVVTSTKAKAPSLLTLQGKPQRLLRSLTNPTGGVTTGTQTCPEKHCKSDSPTTTSPTGNGGSACSGLSAATLFTHNYVDESGVDHVLIEVLGPSDPADAAPVVFTSPHGGYNELVDIPPRTKDNSTYCDPSCIISRDSYSQEIARASANAFIRNYCKVPYVVINLLHRNRLDANREIGEAAFGNAIAEGAWFQFHNLTAVVQQMVVAQFGTVDVTNPNNMDVITGARGILFDVHGYSGTDWVPDSGSPSSDGSPLVQWGYRFSASSLDTDMYCPLDEVSCSGSCSIGTYTHARFLPGQSAECLVRGPGSLGTRFSDHLVRSSLVGVDPDCGYGTPSYEYPSPQAIASDCTYCNDVCSDPTDTCHYYMGGYNLKVHEHLDWQNMQGTKMNAVQAEFPQCMRFANRTSAGRAATHAAVADALSVSICSFLDDLFVSLAGMCA